jgi:hypothetical protein
MSAAVSGKTAAEQTEFLCKALADEISPEGLAVLKRDGQFGSLILGTTTGNGLAIGGINGNSR